MLSWIDLAIVYTVAWSLSRKSENSLLDVFPTLTYRQNPQDFYLLHLFHERNVTVEIP